MHSTQNALQFNASHCNSGTFQCNISSGAKFIHTMKVITGPKEEKYFICISAVLHFWSCSYISAVLKCYSYSVASTLLQIDSVAFLQCWSVASWQCCALTWMGFDWIEWRSRFCTLHTGALCTVHSLQCVLLHSAQWTVHSTHWCIVHCALFTLHTVQYKQDYSFQFLFSQQHAVHSAHCVIQSVQIVLTLCHTICANRVQYELCEQC